LQLCRRTDHVETWSPPYVSPIVALIDARNVLRSRWPNIPEDVLVEGCREWAAREGVTAYVVFDGHAPGGLTGEHELEDGSVVVGTGGESADDWIARRAHELDEFLLVTSDRELRRRARATRTIGGGSFARELTSLE
jgi:predicted RNA-binding protein with PIN domain